MESSDVAAPGGHRTVSVQRIECGELIAERSRFERGVPDEVITIPVYAWLVHHPGGTVLFDTGLAAGLSRGDRVLGYGVDVDPSRTVAAGLVGLGVDPVGVETVVVSHCHFDHVGGLDLVPSARVVVQADELDGFGGFGSERLVEPVRGEYDVFGDGRVVCIPTPGHTRGHQSLRVRLDGGEVVLAGDCCYFQRTLRGGPLPPFGYDLEQQARSLAVLRSMERAGAYVVPGHDQTVAYPPPRRREASQMSVTQSGGS